MNPIIYQLSKPIKYCQKRRTSFNQKKHVHTGIAEASNLMYSISGDIWIYKQDIWIFPQFRLRINKDQKDEKSRYR